MSDSSSLILRSPTSADPPGLNHWGGHQRLIGDPGWGGGSENLQSYTQSGPRAPLEYVPSYITFCNTLVDCRQQWAFQSLGQVVCLSCLRCSSPSGGLSESFQLRLHANEVLVHGWCRPIAFFVPQSSGMMICCLLFSSCKQRLQDRHKKSINNEDLVWLYISLFFTISKVISVKEKVKYS